MSTWTPDFEAMLCEFDRGFEESRGRFRPALHAAFAEYQRQAEAAGYVLVRRDVLQELVNRYGFFRDNKYYLEARDTLAVTPEPAPGGGEG